MGDVRPDTTRDAGADTSGVEHSIANHGTRGAELPTAERAAGLHGHDRTRADGAAAVCRRGRGSAVHRAGLVDASEAVSANRSACRDERTDGTDAGLVPRSEARFSDRAKLPPGHEPQNHTASNRLAERAINSGQGLVASGFVGDGRLRVSLTPGHEPLATENFHVRDPVCRQRQ